MSRNLNYNLSNTWTVKRLLPFAGVLFRAFAAAYGELQLIKKITVSYRGVFRLPF